MFKVGKRSGDAAGKKQEKTGAVMIHLKPKEKVGILAARVQAVVQKAKVVEKSAKESTMANEAHLTKDGVKVIDFHPDTEECLMNKELKEYEKDNRHRYIPRNLSQKNVAIQQKIDTDIA